MNSDRLNTLYDFAFSVLSLYDLSADRACEKLTTYERTVYFTQLFDSQMWRNGPDLWLVNGYASHTTEHVRAALDELGTEAARATREAVDALVAIAPDRDAYDMKPKENEHLKASIIEREEAAKATWLAAREALKEDLTRYAEEHPEASLVRDDAELDRRRPEPGEGFMPHVSQALRWCFSVQGQIEELWEEAEAAGASEEELEVLDVLVDRLADLRIEIADAHGQERAGRELKTGEDEPQRCKDGGQK